MVLRLSIDEREEQDVTGETKTIPFVAAEDVVEQYGVRFSVTLDEYLMPVVVAGA